ncbi:helix-turn-helix domain-containing protein [Streptomyces sp. NPDC046859]|uniref:helix-turn-helix domain-containing protein n=1 Tax=Streptomyces sp. NPDC046859 TaxID=3155734 RepID=UPI0033D8E5F8
MHDEQRGPEQALTELRGRLADGLARMRLNKTDLAGRAGLGRTTVHEVFKADGSVPSAPTVAALARALKLPVEELLALRRDASGNGERSGLGKLIGEWGPHDLEVHPAGPRECVDGDSGLPGYVRRAHDRALDETVKAAAAGRSRIVVLVGTSSTGKTRACWEAVQPLADEGWRLWHPDPSSVEAALEDLRRVQPRTVVWLNEAQHYLGNHAAGELFAADVHQLLISPEHSPVLVLATLWPEYVRQYTALPAAGKEDPHSRARELLSGRTVTIPTAFDAAALAAAAALAGNGDRLLADALTRARTDGRVTQDLAGAPQLLTRYENASEQARALLEAAMDARRLGVGLHLPQAFLIDAAADYLHQIDYDRLTDNWAEAAFAELAEPVHGKQAPLRRTTPRDARRPPTTSASSHQAGPVFRLADYLEQHGRTTRSHLCPPASFWRAAYTHLTRPEDLDNLTKAAEGRHRLEWAHDLQLRAADRGSGGALFRLAELRKKAEDWLGAATLYQQAADRGNTRAMVFLAEQRAEAEDWLGAAALYQQAADHGNTHAMVMLCQIREQAGDRAEAETLALQAADHGDTRALPILTGMREQASDRKGAEILALQAADHGHTGALGVLCQIRERAGDGKGAEILALQAADHGHTSALVKLAELRKESGDRKGAEILARQAADHGDTGALGILCQMRERAGDGKGAEILALQAADHGHTSALVKLAELRKESGDRKGAEILARQAADHGDTGALGILCQMRERAGDGKGAEILALQAADHGHTSALVKLAELREHAGDRKGAETLALQAADHGNTSALIKLAKLREQARDRKGAETLALQAADHGNTHALLHLTAAPVLQRLWPYGLDPDGTPTPRWQRDTSAAVFNGDDMD